MTAKPSIVWLVVLGVLVPGCAVRNWFTVDVHGTYAATPPGPSAVLRVTCRECGSVRTGQQAWGVVNTPNAEARFAEFLAHAARDHGAMDVLAPYDVRHELSGAGLEPTLQPADAQLAQFARALGLGSYLTAHVALWRYSYFFVASSAELECEVACHDAADGRVIWRAQVRRAERGASDRELAVEAMRDLFLNLRNGPGPAEEEAEREP